MARRLTTKTRGLVSDTTRVERLEAGRSSEIAFARMRCTTAGFSPPNLDRGRPLFDESYPE